MVEKEERKRHTQEICTRCVMLNATAAVFLQNLISPILQFQTFCVVKQSENTCRSICSHTTHILSSQGVCCVTTDVDVVHCKCGKLTGLNLGYGINRQVGALHVLLRLTGDTCL